MFNIGLLHIVCVEELILLRLNVQVMVHVAHSDLVSESLFTKIPSLLGSKLYLPRAQSLRCLQSDGNKCA